MEVWTIGFLLGFCLFLVGVASYGTGYDSGHGAYGTCHRTHAVAIGLGKVANTYVCVVENPVN